MKSLSKFGEIQNKIQNKLTQIPNYLELKNDLEIILYICNVIENEIKQNKAKSIDKKQLVLDILQKIFKYTPDEILNINKHIDFMFLNELIKKVSDYEKTSTSALSWLYRRLG